MPRLKHTLAAVAHSCVIAAFVLLVVAQIHDCAFAASYYVRTDGNDANTGTGSSAALAWRTVKGAAEKPLIAGDVVHVQAGIYFGEIQPSVNGTSSNPIQFIADTKGTISGWPTGSVIVQAVSGGKALKVFNDDYLEFYGFQFSGNVGDDTVDVTNSAGTLLSRCQIYGGYKGVDLNSGSLTIQNCLIRNNSDDGVRIEGTLIVRNTTIANSAGDGIEQTSGTSTITNCIVSDNASDGLRLIGGAMTHTYNLLYGNGGANWGGISASTGEISVDPLFASSADYHISILSPARNVGTDLSGTVDDDLDGRPRPAYGSYDIGCYEEGPTGHYKFDETSGTTAYDSSGLGHDGTHVNVPTLGDQGAYGYATTFNASDTNDRTDLPIEVLDGAMDASVAFWVKTTKTGEQIIVGGANSTASAANEFIIFFYNSTTLRPIRNSHVSFSVPSIANDQWNHFVCTWDGDTNTFTAYRNGVSLGSQVASGPTGVPLDIEPGGLVVGQEQDSVGGSFDSSQVLDGSLDDLRIYTRVLNAAEVSFLYNDDGLVGHWRLDETIGTTAADSSISANDGTYSNGPVLGVDGAYPGEVATAAEFDGSNDYVDLGNIDVSGSELTIAAWIKADSFTGSANRILGKANGSGLSNNYWSLTAYASGGSNYLGILLKTDSGGTRFLPSNSEALETGEWIHVAAVYNGSTLKLYKNGEEILSSAITGDVTSGPTVPVWIGGSPSNEKYFDGQIDDVRLYNRGLSATEITELYGLVGHWKMDEGSGSTAADNTAFANDVTLNGATWTSNCAGNNGLEFNGVAGTATTNAVFDPPERGTVALWIRSDGPPAIRQRPWGVGSDFEMWQDPDGFVSCDISTDGFQGGFITTEPLHMDGRWYHLIAEYDSDDDSYAIYINGELHKSGISTWAMVKQAANTLTFGSRTGNSEYFDGAMRDFRIYNRPLSSSEISNLSGLVAYWKLDESSGTVAIDSSPNGNDGTYTNGVTLFQTGNIDQAAEFDGLDDYVGVPDDPSLRMDDVFSLSGWIRSDSSSNIDQMILNKEGEYEIAISPSGELKWGIKNTDPGWSWHSTGHIVAIGKWTHVALIYDHGTATTYANGVLVDIYSGSGAVGDQYTSLNELRLGGRSNNPAGKYFDGRLDDVRLFKRVLCSEEVFGQYRGGRPAGVRILKWVEVR